MVIPICHILDGMFVGYEITLGVLSNKRPQVVEVTMLALSRVFNDTSHQFRLYCQLGIVGVLVTMMYVIPNETCHVSDVCRHVVK